jgi:FkbM family methyltransferase
MMMLKRLAAAITGWRYGLRSKALRDGTYPVAVGGQSVTLYHSSFNLDWLMELGLEVNTVVELGSYDGGDAYRFKKAFPNARVITVEADPTRYDIVQRNLEGQGIEILNCAACATDGDVDWFVSTIDGEPQAQGSMYLHSQKYQKKFPQVQQADKPQKVPGRRFETLGKELFLSEVDFLYMDIEGAEHNVLQSLGEIRPRVIYLEWRRDYFQDTKSSQESEALLARMGYRMILMKKSDRMYFLP